MNLRELAKKGGFNTKCPIISRDTNEVNPLDYYIWMCKLKRWLFENHRIFIDFYFDDMTWTINIGEFTIPDYSADRTVYLEESQGFDGAMSDVDKALEKGLKTALIILEDGI